MERQGRYIPNIQRPERLKRGLSQTAVAKKFGMVNSTQISLWENGHTIPTLDNLVRLSELYEKPIEELYPEYCQMVRTDFRNSNADHFQPVDIHCEYPADTAKNGSPV
jgi:transcriptional regulator with XRE-family HTH domain